jgi:hypothetical protein
MIFNIGYTKNEYQISYFKVDTSLRTAELVTTDLDQIKELALNALFVDSSLDTGALENLLNDEKKFYPIVSNNEFKIDYDNFQSLEFAEIEKIYHKMANRFVLSNNIKTIESLYSTISYLKDLWESDRHSFFEEFWFLIKTNLSTSSLNIIFHDLETTKSEEENSEKHKLIYSFIKGEKIPNLFTGSESEKNLMKEYEKEFQNIFTVTDYNGERNQLVIAANINQSPILLLAELPSFNQLQRSILIALFTGLQKQN